MNFYKRHLGDIAKSCSDLSQGQMGAFDLLLDWHYANEKPLPLSVDKLYLIARARTRAEQGNVDSVLAELFTKTSAGYTHKRAGEEMAKANAQAATNRRIAEEREARKRERTEHEACNDSSTKRQPSQTPDSRLHSSTSSKQSNPGPSGTVWPDDREGSFEGHAIPLTTPNPVAAFAIAMTKAGFSVTSMNPDLVAYVREGGTVDHLLMAASLPDCHGKKAAYAIRIARRELSEGAKPVEQNGRARPVVAPHNPGGGSPAITGDEAKAREREALDLMRAQHQELGFAH